MNRLFRSLAALFLGLAVTATTPEPQIDEAFVMSDAIPPTLASFGFFRGGPDHPAPELIPYTLVTPLFSDYADKRRWIFLPSNTRMTADADGLVQIPVGAAIIKSFGYAQADGSFRTIETRLLLHRANGWVALPYIWRADGSDANLALAGRRMPVTMVDGAGTTRTISYAVPNRNQCRTCHLRDEAVVPVGPRLRNIVMTQRLRAAFSGGVVTTARPLPRWNDAAAPLDARARAYLDVNCAHCHNPHGSASNTGLFLEYERPMEMAVGLWKRPVAAGRGSGGMDYAIVPGDAAHSFMPYRMRGTEPGVMMPELGRSLVHDEGAALIEQWIAAMPPAIPPTGARL